MSNCDKFRAPQNWIDHKIAEKMFNFTTAEKTKMQTTWTTMEKYKSEIDRDLFKKQRLLVSQMIANAKHSHYHQKIQDCNKDQKQLFKVVEALLHQKRKPKLPSCDSVEELTDSFNNFFISKIIRILEALDSSNMNTHYSSNQSSNQICDSLLNVFTPASQDEVPKLILSSPSKSCDLDSLPTWMLKIHLDTLLPVITKTVNLSLDTASFPSTFKNALVTTLLKKPNLDSNNFKIFCPVSNLNFVSKIIEKVVASRLTEYLSPNGLFEPFQSAYKQYHGTETALVRVQTDIVFSWQQMWCFSYVVKPLCSLCHHW